MTGGESAACIYWSEGSGTSGRELKVEYICISFMVAIVVCYFIYQLPTVCLAYVAKFCFFSVSFAAYHYDVLVSHDNEGPFLTEISGHLRKLPTLYQRHCMPS